MSDPVEQDGGKSGSNDEAGMGQRLDQLKRHIDTVERRDAQDDDSRKPVSRRRRQGVGKALRLGTEFVAGVAVGGFIGFWIDRLAGTWPIWFVVFFLLGTAAGFLNVFRTAREIQLEQSEAEKRGAFDLPDDADED